MRLKGNSFLLRFRRRTLAELKSYLYRSRKTLLLIIVVVTITTISNALIANWLSRSYSDGVAIPSLGTVYVTGVEAYGGDIKTVDGVATIDWGAIQWGDSKKISFCLRSISNVQTRLAFNTTDWNPKGIENYVTLSWNYNGTQLEPKQEILVSFTLSAPDTRNFADYLVANRITSYNFTIYIYPME